MKIQVLSIICLISIGLHSTLKKDTYFNFIKAIHKNDFQTASLIFSSLSLADYSQRIDNCVSIKGKLICKKASLNNDLNLGYNREKEIQEVNLMLQKIEEEEKKARLKEISNSCCSIQ